MKLNAEQEAAASTREGSYCVLAGPGAGKSSVLVERFARLLHEDIPSTDILSLSFTSEAAKSLRGRVEARGLELVKNDRVSGFVTFHSWALSGVTAEHERFPFHLAAFPLATEGQCAKIIGEAARKFETHYRDLAPWISLQKRNRVRPTEALKQAEKEGVGQKLALAYKQYDEKLREMGVLDFDSLLLEMVTLLETNAEVRARYQYKFCQMDEAQDTDLLQFRLLQLLTEEHGNLFAVGDAGQSIFSWRGAQPEYFLHMEQFFPGCQKLFLATNFRSTQSIVDMLRVIGPVKELAEKFVTSNELGVPPTIVQFPDETREAKAIAVLIENGDPSGSAVLARTNRALRPIEDALSEAGIKFYCVGKSGFYSRPEICAVLAYLNCAYGNANDNAVLTALRAPYQPSRFLKKKLLADGLKDTQKRDPAKPSIISLLYNHSEAGAQGFGRFLWGLKKYRDMPAAYAVKEVLRETKALQYYMDEESTEADNSPVENINELAKIAGRFPSLGDMLAHARRAQAAARNRKGTALSTVHGYKGLEQESVYLIQCQEGVLPHAKAENVQEESHIFFVACSRAEQNLHISYVGQPSRFLAPFLKEESVHITA